MSSSRSVSGILIAATLATLLAPAPTRAAWAPNGEPVCVAPWQEIVYSSVPDGAGGVILVWHDNRPGTDIDPHYDIYAQRRLPSGAIAPGWIANGTPVCLASGNQEWPRAVPDGAGGAILVWQDYRSGWGIYAQRMDANGHALWTPDGVSLCDLGSRHMLQRVASDGHGGVVVTWLDNRDAPPPEPPHFHYVYDVYAQRLDPNGQRLWTAQGVPVCADPSDANSSTVMTDGADGFLVVWQDGRGSAYVQRMNSAGQPLWTANGKAIPGPFLDPYGSRIVSDGAGGMISAYMTGPDTQGDLFVEKLDANGNRAWSTTGVPLSTASWDQRPNAIVSDGAGGAIVAWYDLRNGMDWDVYAQRVGADGNLAAGWPAGGLPICTLPGFQVYPAAVADGAGGAIVSWYDVRDSSTLYDIYAVRINAGGQRAPGWPASGVALCKAAGDQSAPVMAPDATGGAYVAWVDNRVGLDVYATRVSGAGVVGESTVDVEPSAPRLALEPVRPNPAHAGRLTLSFTLPDASPARVLVVDVAGRQVMSRDVGGLGAGNHVLALGESSRLVPGVYQASLGRGRDLRVRRFVVLP